MAVVDKEASAEDAALEARVDAILAQNPQMSAQDLINVPEVNEGVREFFRQLSQSPELQNKINSSIGFAAEMKDLKGPRENLSFKMDLSGYSKERTRRLITLGGDFTDTPVFGVLGFGSTEMPLFDLGKPGANQYRLRFHSEETEIAKFVAS